MSAAGYYVTVHAVPLDRAMSMFSNPHFVNRAENDFRMGAGSPIIDAGNNAFPGLDAVDIAGSSRIVNGTIDIGTSAYNDDEIFKSEFETPAF